MTGPKDHKDLIEFLLSWLYNEDTQIGSGIPPLKIERRRPGGVGGSSPHFHSFSLCLGSFWLPMENGQD